MIANTPKPPYYAVIFTSIRSGKDSGYEEISKNMVELVKKQKGYLGMESARENVGITISYWDSIDAIKLWKNNVDHIAAQKKGRSDWYTYFKVRIAKVEREYSMDVI